MPADDRQVFRDATEICACQNFRKAARAVTQLFDEVLQPSGLRSTQFVILAALRAHEPISVPKLARELVIDRSTLSRNLSRLERAGLVRRRPGSGGRARPMELTDDGREQVDAIVPLWRQAQERFVAQLGDDDWSELLTRLGRAVDAARLA